MPSPHPKDWATLLRAAAAPALAGTPLDFNAIDSPDRAMSWIEGFRDSAGNRRRVDRPLLCLLLGLDPGSAPEGKQDLALHERLWWSLVRGDTLPIEVSGHDGPLAPAMQAQGIEAWTECELSALHALWSIARIRKDARLHERAKSAARWLMRDIQPDNATNRPWAAHVFLGLSREEGDDAGLYARTLIHNAMIPNGMPERFSACILRHAAAELECMDAVL
jgi:hypothetical protein